VTASKGFLIRSAPVVALAILLACGGRSPGSGASPESAAMLQVENRSFADMVIYAVSGAQRVRLGLATGNSTKSFTVPSSLIRGAGPLRFLADPIGGSRAPISEEMMVQPGDIVTLTIPP
jgi:hypothetical protein